MKKPMLIRIAVLSILLVGLSGGGAAAQELPIVKGKKIVATVKVVIFNGDTRKTTLLHKLQSVVSAGPGFAYKEDWELLLPRQRHCTFKFARTDG